MNDPFIILSAIFDHESMVMEDKRKIMDERICRQEATSGVAVHNFYRSAQASINDFAMLKLDLYKSDAFPACL
jgi:hypothetical protein